MVSNNTHSIQALPSTFLWLGRVMVLALLVYLPWNYGNVRWSDQIVQQYWIIAIIGVTLAYLLISKKEQLWIKLGFLHFVLVAFLVLGLLQATLLPHFLYEMLSPVASFNRELLVQTRSMLPESVFQNSELPEVFVPSSRTTSIYPLQTLCSLHGIVSALVLLLAGGILFHDRRGRWLLLIGLTTLSTIVAIVGIFQSISWDSWTLLKMPNRNGFATFVSRNSAPQYLAIGLGAALSLILLLKRHKEQNRSQEYQATYAANSPIARFRQLMEELLLELNATTVALLSVLVIHLVAIVAAASRGGIVSMILAGGISLLFYLANNRRWIVAGLIGLATLGGLTSMTLSFFELDQRAIERMQDLSSHERVELWRNSLSLSQYWLTGSGMGTYRFAIMQSNPFNSAWPHHAENIFVEIAVEFGWMGLALALAALVWIGRNLLPTKSSKSQMMWPAAVYSVTAIAIHSTVDFSLILPAIYLPIATLLGAFLFEHYKHSTLRRERSQLHQFRQHRRQFIWTVASLVGLGAVSWLTYRPLHGFAQAEQIHKLFHTPSSNMPDENGQRSWSSLYQQLEAMNLDYSHPEVVLELTRGRLMQLESSIRSLPNWPNKLPSSQQKQLSSAEFIAAVLRSKNSNEPWLAWKDYFAGQSEVARQINLCQQGFVFAARGCALDWRSTWGIFQTRLDADSWNSTLTWAKANRLCNSVFNTQEVLGTCSLIAGNRSLGIQSWKEAVEKNPARAAELAKLIGNLLTIEDVLKIVPNHSLAVAAICRTLDKQTEMKSQALALLEEVNLGDLEALSNNVADLELTAWAAERMGDETVLLSALNKIADLKPLDVPIRIRLAKIYQERGNIDLAIQLLEQAGRRNNLNSSAQRYLQELRKLPPPK